MNETARGDRRLRHGRRDAVRARRRRAVLLALRPRADLPRADRRPGHRGGARRRPPRRCPPVEGRSPGYQIQSQNPLLHDLPRRPRRQDRLHRRRPAHLRHRGRAQRPAAGGQRDGHREHARCAPPTRRPALLDWGFAVPAGTPRASARWSHAGRGRASPRRPPRPRRGRPAAARPAPRRARRPPTAGVPRVVPVAAAGARRPDSSPPTVVGRRRGGQAGTGAASGRGPAAPPPPGGGSPSTPP